MNHQACENLCIYIEMVIFVSKVFKLFPHHNYVHNVTNERI